MSQSIQPAKFVDGANATTTGMRAAPAESPRGGKIMAALIRIVVVVLIAVVPGGLLMLSAFILARIVAARLREQHGPHRLTQALAGLSFRDVWNETRRSL
jgi:hypothetical protein